MDFVRTVTKLVPLLTEVENCSDIPQEVCSKKRGKPRKVTYPTVKTWCYETEEKEEVKCVSNVMNSILNLCKFRNPDMEDRRN